MGRIMSKENKVRKIIKESLIKNGMTGPEADIYMSTHEKAVKKGSFESLNKTNKKSDMLEVPVEKNTDWLYIYNIDNDIKYILKDKDEVTLIKYSLNIGYEFECRLNKKVIEDVEELLNDFRNMEVELQYEYCALLRGERTKKSGLISKEDRKKIKQHARNQEDKRIMNNMNISDKFITRLGTFTPFAVLIFVANVLPDSDAGIWLVIISFIVGAYINVSKMTDSEDDLKKKAYNK